MQTSKLISALLLRVNGSAVGSCRLALFRH